MSEITSENLSWDSQAHWPLLESELKITLFLTAVGITVADGTEHPSFLALFIVWWDLLNPVVLYSLSAFLSSDGGLGHSTWLCSIHVTILSSLR